MKDAAADQRKLEVDAKAKQDKAAADKEIADKKQALDEELKKTQAEAKKVQDDFTK